VLAALVARDCEVRRRFRDGIAMIEVGKQPNLIELQARLGALVGLEAKEFTGDLDANRQRLSQAFRDKHMLIVLDNVWQGDASTRSTAARKDSNSSSPRASSRSPITTAPCAWTCSRIAKAAS
jgi:hypothetical protein